MNMLSYGMHRSSSLPLLQTRMTFNENPIRCQVKNFYLDFDEISSLYQTMLEPLHKSDEGFARIKKQKKNIPTRFVKGLKMINKKDNKEKIYFPKNQTYEEKLKKGLGIKQIPFENDFIFPLVSSKQTKIKNLNAKEQFYVIKKELKFNDRHNMQYYLAKQDKFYPSSFKQAYAMQKKIENQDKEYALYPSF